MKPCPRCLLYEINEADFARQIYDHIAALPAEQRADEAMYCIRLDLCQSCDMLVNGMCKLCGCFVELRAAKKEQLCPSPSPRW